MKIALDNRAFIFGGAYGNLQATQAILRQADHLGFASSEIIFTGDSVAYCANPQETAQLIRTSNIHAISGNCEEALASGALDCGCGFEEGSACDALSQEWFKFCQNALSDNSKRWMGSLPQYLEISINGFNILCTHATPEHNNEFVFASDIQQKRFMLSKDKYDGYIVGHSGIPYVAEINNKFWINSGSSGMPANDGTTKVWYSTINTSDGILNAETYALEYDYRSAHDAMLSVGLNNGYADGLVSGLWPSLDVLPDVEKLQTGIALQTQKKAFRKTPFPLTNHELA